MVDVYLSVSDVELYSGLTFTTSTNPTLAQVEEFITLAENDFERDVGVYKELTITDEIQDGLHYGFNVNNLPLQSVTQILPNEGTKFEPSWGSALSSTDYYISNANLGKIILASPISGQRVYKIDYTSGYSYSNMPREIKYLVYLYTMAKVFDNTLFDTQGNVGGNTEIIDVQVYKEITNGGSAFEGTVAIRKTIEDYKGRYFKGKLKTYLK